MHIVFGFILLLLGSFTVTAQELVSNGGAEDFIWNGWHQVNPNDTWTQGSPPNTRAPHGGTYVFYPGDNTGSGGSDVTELYQNISLSSYTAAIDAGTASFTFSGWRRGYKNTTPFSNDRDESEIIVEYRDASGNVLYSYDTGSSVFSSWTQNTDTHIAPIGTRSVRIRLISHRFNTASNKDNDGYYDDISFVYNAPTCIPPTSIQLTPGTTSTYCLGSNLNITGTVTPSNSNYYYSWYLGGTQITAPSQTYTPITKTNTVAGDAGIYTLRVEDGNTGTATCYKESSVTIVLDAPPVAGTISSDPETCGNTIPAPFTGTASTGGTAAKYYKWQISTGSSLGPWVDVQAFSSTATGYTSTTPVTLINYYRRVDSSGTCANAPTNVLTIKAKTPPPLDPITSLVRDTLCVGENFQLIPHLTGPGIPFSMNGGFYYTWKKIQGATTTIVAPTSTPLSTYPASSRAATLADSGTYYLIAQDGPGVTQCKDSVKIVIRINQAPTTKALIKSNQEFCVGTPASQLTESIPAAGIIGTPVYHQWYTTTDTSGTPILSKISAATGINYNPGTPATTAYYVRTDSVKYCNAVKTNFLKIRVNNKPILDSIRATVNDTLCVNYGDQFQLKGYVDSLTAGKQSLNGGFYFTWKKVQQPAAIPVVVSATGKYTDYPAVSRAAVEADSGTYYLIVQDGINATQCLDSISLKMVVSNNCVAVTCVKPDFVSIKVSPATNSIVCEGGIIYLQQDVITLPATPPVYGYTYSWERTNALGTAVLQAPSTSYHDLYINPAALSDSGRYRLIVRDGFNTIAACAESSQDIDIVMIPTNYATVSLSSGLTCESTDLLLTATTTNAGASPLYMWQYGPSASGPWNSIPGETTANLLVTNPQMSDSGTVYKVIVFPSAACTDQVETTVVLQVQRHVQPTVSVAAKPSGLVCDTLQSITYTATPIQGQGTSPTYQWYNGNTNAAVSGATNIQYTPTGIPANGDKVYVVMTSNLNCSSIATSAVSVLNMVAKPNPSISAKDTTLCLPNNLVIAASNITTGSSYQWYNNGTPIIGATHSSYTVSSADFPGGVYSFKESNAACATVAVNTVNVILINPPVVSAGPDVSVTKNTPVTLQGSVTGSTNYVWSPSSGLSDPGILTPDALITHDITYTLTAYDPTGLCPAQSSVNIWVKAPLVIPNVLTPNGDGANDTWKIENIEDYPNATFIIYNRWGNIVWKASGNAFQWNGTNYRNGELLADGTYFYVIDLQSTSYSEPFTGYIQIIK